MPFKQTGPRHTPKATARTSILNPATDTDAQEILRTQHNGIWNDVTKALQWFQQVGVAYWINSTTNGGSAFSYAKNAIVMYTDGNVYQSLVASNTATPGSAPASWQLIGAAGQQQQAGNYVATAGGTANALTASLNPASASNAALEGVPLRVKITTTSTSTTPTIAFDGHTALNIINSDGSAVTPGRLVAGAVETFITTDGVNAQVGGAGSLSQVAERILGKITAANLNITTDQTFSAVGGALPAKFVITGLMATNASTSLASSAARGGCYTAAGKTGTTIVPATADYTELAAASNIEWMTRADLDAAGFPSGTLTALPIWALTTGHGSAATADIYLKGVPLP